MRSLLLLSSALIAFPAFAQDAPPPQDERPAADHVHEEIGAEVVVTAPFVSSLNILAGTSALTGNDLAREIRPQLGDTLARLPGVSATSFSPGSSRPVLRGFQGERVRVLVDGIGSIDVSNT